MKVGEMGRVWSVVRFDGPDGPEEHQMAASVSRPDVPYLLASEAAEIERTTGNKPVPWVAALTELDPTAWIALVALLRRRAGQDVRFSEVDFDLFSAALLDVDDDGKPIEVDEMAPQGAPDPI